PCPSKLRVNLSAALDCLLPPNTSRSASGSAFETKRNFPAPKNSAPKSPATSPPLTNFSPACGVSDRFASLPPLAVDRSPPAVPHLLSRITAQQCMVTGRGDLAFER